MGNKWKRRRFFILWGVICLVVGCGGRTDSAKYLEKQNDRMVCKAGVFNDENTDVCIELCGHGDSRSCGLAGTDLRFSNPAKALELFKVSCNNGVSKENGMACHSAGLIAEEIHLSDSEISNYYSLSCDKLFGGGCEKIALDGYITGKMRIEEIRLLLDKACKMGYIFTCGWFQPCPPERFTEEHRKMLSEVWDRYCDESPLYESCIPHSNSGYERNKEMVKNHTGVAQCPE